MADPRKSNPAHEVTRQINAVMIFMRVIPFFPGRAGFEPGMCRPKGRRHRSTRQDVAFTRSSGSSGWRFPIVSVDFGLPPASMGFHRTPDVVGIAVFQFA